MKRLIAVAAVTIVSALTLGVAQAGSSPATSCTHGLVTVRLSVKKHPNIIAHIKLSWRRGYPRILHVHRAGADARRDAVLRGIPTKPGYDRDEAPAAVLRRTVRADVAYVPSSENRSAGATLGNAIAGACEGAPVRYSFGW